MRWIAVAEVNVLTSARGTRQVRVYIALEAEPSFSTSLDSIHALLWLLLLSQAALQAAGGRALPGGPARHDPRGRTPRQTPLLRQLLSRAPGPRGGLPGSPPATEPHSRPQRVRLREPSRVSLHPHFSRSPFPVSLSHPPSSCSHVCVSLKIIEKLLTECDAQRLQLITDSYLSMLHSMLESSDPDFQIMATDSVRSSVSFANRILISLSSLSLSLSLSLSPVCDVLRERGADYSLPSSVRFLHPPLHGNVPRQIIRDDPLLPPVREKEGGREGGGWGWQRTKPHHNFRLTSLFCLSVSLSLSLSLPLSLSLSLLGSERQVCGACEE